MKFLNISLRREQKIYLHRSRKPKRSSITLRWDNIQKLILRLARKAFPEVYACKPITYTITQEPINHWCVLAKNTRGITRVILAGYSLKKQAENARDALSLVNELAVKNAYSTQWMSDFEYALAVRNFHSRVTVAIWNAQELFPNETPKRWLSKAAIQCDCTTAEIVSWGTPLTEAYAHRPSVWLPEITGDSVHRYTETSTQGSM